MVPGLFKKGKIMKVEIWKMIPGYEGLYMVSNLGRVKSLNYNHTGEEAILKPIKLKHGYLCVHLVKNGKTFQLKVHRLVAMAFIPNPNNLPCVNHKDEDKANNCVDNLEWCTYEHNNNYGTRNKRISKKQKNRKDCSKPILQFTLDGAFVAEWPSLKEIERQLGLNGRHIPECCRGIYRQSHGYVWRYASL